MAEKVEKVEKASEDAPVEAVWDRGDESVVDPQAGPRLSGPPWPVVRRDTPEPNTNMSERAKSRTSSTKKKVDADDVADKAVRSSSTKTARRS